MRTASPPTIQVMTPAGPASEATWDAANSHPDPNIDPNPIKRRSSAERLLLKDPVSCVIAQADTKFGQTRFSPPIELNRCHDNGVSCPYPASKPGDARLVVRRKASLQVQLCAYNHGVIRLELLRETESRPILANRKRLQPAAA
jgi:hypothetical protein